MTSIFLRIRIPTNLRAMHLQNLKLEDIADYAVRLFSGLVTLYNRTLKFAVPICLMILHVSLDLRI